MKHSVPATNAKNAKAGVSLACVGLWVAILLLGGSTTDHDGKTTLTFVLACVSATALVCGLVGGLSRLEKSGKTLSFICAGASLLMFVLSAGIFLSYLN
jgi:hypothetical protein